MSLRELENSWLLRIHFHNSYWTKCQSETAYKLTLKDLKRHKVRAFCFNRWYFTSVLLCPIHLLTRWIFTRAYEELDVAPVPETAVNKTEAGHFLGGRGRKANVRRFMLGRLHTESSEKRTWEQPAGPPRRWDRIRGGFYLTQTVLIFCLFFNK